MTGWWKTGASKEQEAETRCPRNISKVIKEREWGRENTQWQCMSKQCNSKCVFQKVKRKQRAGSVCRNFQSCFQVTHRIEVLKDLWARDLCIIGSFKNPEMAARAKYNVHFWNHKKSFVLQQAELTEVEFQWSMFWLWVSLFSLASLPRKPFLTSPVVFLLVLQLQKSRQDLDAPYLNENWLPVYLWFWWRE